MGDADITLRHIVRQHPEALVQAMGMKGRVEILGWLDTQVTALERRLDKALALRVNGKRRALHVEFEYELDGTIGRRVHEYQGLFALALSAEAPDRPLPRIASLVVALSGREKPWPATGKLRTGWPELPWSGTRYRVDAVYQRTVAELHARGSLLWLVFTPLARDVTLPEIGRVIGELRERATDAQELADLYTALLVMADIDPWGYHLREETAAMLESRTKDLIQVSKTLRDAFEKGKTEGLETGLEKGLERGREKGRQEGIDAMLRRIFTRRLGRGLTEAEQRALATRTHTLDPGDVQDRALTLEGERLAAWLLDPNAK